MVNQRGGRRDGLLALEKTLILCGFAGSFEEYVPVLLVAGNMSENTKGYNF